MKAFITGTGIVSPAGNGIHELLETLERPERRISPLALFPVSTGVPLPVGEVSRFAAPAYIPRTHALAMAAARQALGGETPEPPDAVLVGTTTGGILTTESLISEGNRDPERFRWHAAGTVGDYIARCLGCVGPVLTVSSACASGTAILKIALEMIRTGTAGRILVVGVDSLCRLTYHGFSLLKLVDPTGARPFDKDRSGMTVAEAAAALLVEAGDDVSAGAICELSGGGLSCDAYHVTAPDKEGRGAAEAMKRALEDAGIGPEQVDYVNLHGTGTRDNDAAEARAVRAVFGEGGVPACSSTKGVYGHPLAAAGVVEAVIGAQCVRHGILPGNTGCSSPDPALGLVPLSATERGAVDVVLSNSFGFSGNNACAVLSRPRPTGGRRDLESRKGFRILGSACLTGAGALRDTWEALESEASCRGMAPQEEVRRGLDPAATRRLKRLPCLTLSLAIAAQADSGRLEQPGSVYFGTGLGALSETYDFLAKLFQTGQRFSSPTDFVGSLHNAPAGQVALHFGSRGPNVTSTGTDDSFEQALLCAGLLSRESIAPILCIGAEEAHALLTPLIDASTQADPTLSDGGGALILEPEAAQEKTNLLPLSVGLPGQDESVMAVLLHALGGIEAVNDRFGAIFAGIPHASRTRAEEQLSRFLSVTGFPGLVVDYRRTLGHYGAVSAAACVLAWKCAQSGRIPRVFAKGGGASLGGKGILMLGLGYKVSAVAVCRQAPGV